MPILMWVVLVSMPVMSVIQGSMLMPMQVVSMSMQMVPIQVPWLRYRCADILSWLAGGSGLSDRA